MKVGDLVTLSSYGLNMGPQWNWRRQTREGKPLIGIVIKVRDNPNIRSWSSENERILFYIEWCGEGPVSRDNGSPKKSHGNAPEDYYYFLRNDLRYVK